MGVVCYCSYDRLKAKTAISITPIPEPPTRATQFLRENEISKSSTSLHPCFPPTLALSCCAGTKLPTLKRLHILAFLPLSSESLQTSHFQTVTLDA